LLSPVGCSSRKESIAETAAVLDAITIRVENGMNCGWTTAAVPEYMCRSVTPSRFELGDEMQYLTTVLFSLLALSSAATPAERLRFWNLTGFTIKELHLAPTGTTDWGFDQCKNDPDGAVDADERLTLKNVVPGHYDVKLVDKQGRTCVVRNVEVQAGNPTRSQFPKRT
jgi:hypothetical protein